MGDYAGLTRLDGAHVRRYNANEVEAMVEGYILSILPLANGDVLIGGDREGVLYWDYRIDEFTPLTLSDGSRLTRINALRPGRHGQVWVAAEQGLFQLDLHDRVLIPVDGRGLEATASRRVFDVQEMADGSLWLAAQPGLYLRHPGQPHWEPAAVKDPRLQRRLREEPAWRLLLDPRGRLWVGLMREGVVVVDSNGKAHAPDGLDGMAGLHNGTTIRSLLWDEARNRMLVGTDGKGLLAVEGRGSRRVAVNLRSFTGGRNFHVRGMIRARDGRIWAASDRGVFHFDPAPAIAVELDASVPGNEPYEWPTLGRAIHVDSRGRVWLGQTEGIIQVFDPGSGQRHVIRLPAPMDSAGASTMISDGHGRVWVAGQGVMQVDEETLQVLPPLASSELSRRRYVDLVSDGQRVWLTHQEGLLELDMDGRVLRRMESTRDGLLTTRLGIAALHKGELWVGSSEGVHRIDLKNWKAIPVGLAPDVAGIDRATSSLMINDRGVHAGAVGGMVFGGGRHPEALVPVFRTDRKEVRGILGDGKGGMWLSVDNAGARLHWLDHRGYHHPLGVRHGLHSGMVLYRDVLAWTPDGLLVAATDTGAVLVDPVAFREASVESVDLSPRLFSITLDGEQLPADRLPGPERPLRLDHNVERVVMAFSALDYTGQGLRQYSYRLEGLDSRWNMVDGGEPMLFYSRLPPGHYTLLLRTTSSEYPGQEWITPIPVEVVPEWYQTGWSRLLMGVGLAAMILVWVHLGLRRARLAQQKLASMVARRTAELEQANVRLERLASQDMLTGLLNRRRALEELARRQDMPCPEGRSDAVMLLDLDHFKQINDTYGHLAGDAVLREVGKRLRDVLRAGDIVARYGGEELLIVLVEVDADAAADTADRLLAVLRERPVVHDGQTIAIRGSLGLTLRLEGEPVELALARADAALYQAKEQGRDRWRSAF